MKELNSSKSLSFVLWVVSFVMTIFSGIVIIGYALDTVNLLNFSRLSVAMILVIMSLVIFFIRSKPMFSKSEVIQSLVILVGFFYIGIEPTLFSLYPVSHSVDFAHHFTLIDYIYEHQTLVKELQGNLGEMNRYPFGVDFIQAYLSWVTGIDTLRIGHLFLSLIFSFSSLVLYGLIAKIFSNKDAGNLVAFCSPLLLLLLKEYSLYEFWVSYHSSQMLGTLVVLVSMLLLTEVGKSRFFEMVLIVGSVMLLLTFPLWIAILNLFVVLYYMFSKRIAEKRVGRILAFLIPQIVAFIFFYIHGYVTSSIGIADHNGGTTSFSPSVFGGYTLIVLFALGIFLFLKRIKVVQSQEVIVSLAFLGTMIQYLSLKYLSTIGFGSEYIVNKTFFLVKFFYFIFIAYTLVEITKYMKLSKFTVRTKYVASICLFIILFSVVVFSSTHRTPLIMKGEHELSLDLKDSEIKSKIIPFPYPRSPVTSYLLYIGLLQQDRNEKSLDYYNDQNIPSIIEWIGGVGKEDHALIGDVNKQLIEQNLLRYVTVEDSYQNSAVVKRKTKQLEFKRDGGILNASFESEGSWEKVSYNGKDFQSVLDTMIHYEGNTSLKITGSLLNGGVFQTINVEKGKFYKITAWSKGNGISREHGSGVFMVIEGSNDKVVEWPLGDYDWQKREMVFYSNDLTEIKLVLGMGAFGSTSGQVWFDKIDLSKEDVAQ